MRAEQLIRAVGDLDELLLAEPLPKKRRNFRPLIAVAAVAAALAITAGAVSVLAPEVFTFRNSEGEEQIAARSRYGGTQFAPGVLEELMEAEKRYRETENVDDLYFEFDSLPELEDYLGVRLLRSSEQVVNGCSFHVFCPYRHEVRAQDMYVFVQYGRRGENAAGNPFRFYIRLAVSENAVGTVYTEAPVEAPETVWYDIEALGVTATVVKGMYNGRSTIAYFVKDGISYEVENFYCPIDKMCAFLETLSY